MSRKFNVGRQNDLLLNEKMHSLYTHLEFITYKDGDGNTITMPRQTKQTAIPQGALWLQHPMGTNTHKLRVHTDPYATDMESRWPCLFEGYYHPADLTTMPLNPVHGQIWIDDKFTLRVYNANGVEGKWEDVCTKLVADTKYDIFNGMDFQLIDPLLPLELDTGEDLDLYAVPYESFGKYYTAKNHEDEYIYCHPYNNPKNIRIPNYNPQQAENVISVDSESNGYAAKSWVHINPYNLDKITKRLVKINKPKKYYKDIRSEIKPPIGYFEDEENINKTINECIEEYAIEKVNDKGEKIKAIYIDDENHMVLVNYQPQAYNLSTMAVEEVPGDDYDSEMNVTPLDPNPIPDDDYDSGMNNDEYQEIPPEDEYDTGMNVTPLDPNPVPDDDFDSGMNNDEYQEIPPEDEYDTGMNVVPEPVPGWIKYKEVIILKVVDNNIRLVEFDPNTMIKIGTANKNKYNKSSADFKVNDYVTFVEVTDQNTGFINIPAGKTEYFAFKSPTFNGHDEYDNRIGRLLKRYSLKEGIKDENVGDNEVILDNRNDYEIRNGGIVLDKNIYEKYDYIYALTYDFKPNHSKDGNLIRISRDSLDGPDQMWIGPVSGIPVVFMDGLYLEHYGDKGTSIYTYENENIIFAGNDVLDNMQITVISFPQVNTYTDGYGIKYPKEYTITANSIRNRYDICDASDQGALQVVDIPLDNSTTSIAYVDVIAQTPDLRNKIDNSGNYFVRISDTKDAIVYGDAGDSLFSGPENFPNPLIFYNGLAGYTFVANEVDIDYENNSITVHDFGAINDYNGLSTIFAVSLGENNYRNNGVLIDGVAYDDNIHADKPYMVIVDGIVMSPYNEDITIEEGKITITDATLALDSEYTVVELTDMDDDLINDTDAIICIYDDMFAPYSIPIINPKAQNTSNAYDDCDSAVVMCGPGVLVDREALQRDFDGSDTFIGGQIVKHRLRSVTGDEIYEWRRYTYSNEYEVLDPILEADTINDCDHFITYYINDGTVLLNPVNIDDQPITVYAYTYVDSVDEKLRRGHRLIPINVHETGKMNTYTTNRTHLYDVGVNGLSTFVNGVMVPHVEKPTTDIKGDLFYVNEQLSSTFVPFINRYREEQCENRYREQDMYNVLQAINENTVLEDEIIVLTNNNIKDHCLAMKYFNSDHQLAQAKALKKYVEENMQNNNLAYVIENVENNETVACHRHWNAPRNENGNLPNSYTTNMRLTPGIINVYVNGVLLEKSDYAVFDNNKIMIAFDLVGGQEILPIHKGDYAHPYRVIADGELKYIECENDDEVLIEVRDDLTLKKRTYPIKDVSYETYSFDILDYDYPVSLSQTRDVIKIYINGVLYDGDYTNIEGVITLLECSLEEDPLYKYLRMNPSMMKEYEEKYGEYIKHEDTITFEWR